MQRRTLGPENEDEPDTAQMGYGGSVMQPPQNRRMVPQYPEAAYQDGYYEEEQVSQASMPSTVMGTAVMQAPPNDNPNEDPEAKLWAIPKDAPYFMHDDRRQRNFSQPLVPPQMVTPFGLQPIPTRGGRRQFSQQRPEVEQPWRHDLFDQVLSEAATPQASFSRSRNNAARGSRRQGYANYDPRQSQQQIPNSNPPPSQQKRQVQVTVIKHGSSGAPPVISTISTEVPQKPSQGQPQEVPEQSQVVSTSKSHRYLGRPSARPQEQAEGSPQPQPPQTPEPVSTEAPPTVSVSTQEEHAAREPPNVEVQSQAPQTANTPFPQTRQSVVSSQRHTLSVRYEYKKPMNSPASPQVQSSPQPALSLRDEKVLAAVFIPKSNQVPAENIMEKIPPILISDVEFHPRQKDTASNTSQTAAQNPADSQTKTNQVFDVTAPAFECTPRKTETTETQPSAPTTDSTPTTTEAVTTAQEATNPSPVPPNNDTAETPKQTETQVEADSNSKAQEESAKTD
ncbi:hypothetical protein Pelo_2696 [Pelomyxa schiedti]|nr:hypothetical protein Pelo_2696 [Pelomyxa schiedti]